MSNNPLPNTILARLEYSFKGEALRLETVIDLDRCLAHGEDAPDFHGALARAGGVDPYSYLFEILESEDIRFFEPAGLAIDCCIDGQFDWDAFVRGARDARDIQVVQAIAVRELGVTDLDAHAELKAALLAAYREGCARGEVQRPLTPQPSGALA